MSGQFTIKFRVSLFWKPQNEFDSSQCKKMVNWNIDTRTSASVELGDQKYQEDVPPLGLLNAKQFEEGRQGAEVHLLRSLSGKLTMRWTCEYTAILTQPQLYCSRRRGGLASFPYDSHKLDVHLAITYGRFASARIEAVLDKADLPAEIPPGKQPCGHIEDTVALPEYIIAPMLQITAGPRLTVGISIWRRSFQIEGLLRLNSILVMMAMATFALSPEELPDRLAHILAVLFGVIGLRFIVDSTLPKLDFNTFAQHQMNSAVYALFFLVVSSSCIHVYLTNFAGSDKEAAVTIAQRADLACAAVLLLYLGVGALSGYRLKREHLLLKPPESVEDEHGRPARPEAQKAHDDTTTRSPPVSLL